MLLNPLPFALTLGGITFLLTVIWGGPFVEVMRRLKIGQSIRVDSPEWHRSKEGTPTMGGLLILVPVFLITLGLNLVNLIRPSAERVTGVSILLPLFILVGYGLLGGIDDWIKLRSKGEGLSIKAKLAGQIGLAAMAAFTMSLAGSGTHVGIQFANEIYIPIMGITLPLSPWLYIPLVILVIVGMSNAVNFTDGLDGLAGTVTASAFAAYGLVSLLQGQIFLVQFCFIMVGACFAFLWYNAVPAQLFMGDVGALALGAALAIVAFMTGQWVLLPLIAFIPVAEAVSDVLQIIFFRWTGGQRLFRRAPIHFHFQLGGWSETQVVQRFWLISILSAMIGVALALIR
ncbi:MAG TPA: phospho-N-acetylmuramoyl-pentapeptide-transferase [Aggregatilineales bacterium]|nr:phospho-N-acetylmuramoyl-pentapeptide-transferase [Aggregatilineales bacterium]